MENVETVNEGNFNWFLNISLPDFLYRLSVWTLRSKTQLFPLTYQIHSSGFWKEESILL